MAGVRVKRMFRPDDEDKPFVARWNALVRIMLVETSVKMVARSLMDFADYGDGTSCYPSTERIVRETGYSDKTVRTALATLRGVDMAVRVSHGVSYRRLADAYELAIPGDWLGLPLLGPHGQKFTCLHCSKGFNPSGNSTVRPDGKVVFDLRPMTFCSVPTAKQPLPSTPAARKRVSLGKPASCLQLWSTGQESVGAQPYWGKDVDRWKLFYQARGDDW